MPNLLPNTLDVNIVRLFKALFDQAPGFTLLSAYRQLNTVQAVSTELNAQFASLSNAQWASLIAGNLHMTGQAFTVARDYLIIQQNTVPAAQVVAHRAAMLPGLLLGFADRFESDGLFGNDARYFNNSVLTAYQYSINPANTSVDPAVLALADEPNTPPVAVADTNSANEGGSAIAGTVAANDTDAERDPLTFALAPTQAPVPGLVFNTNGTYTFDPTNAAYDSIRAGTTRDVVVNYRVTDSEGGSSDSTLTIRVSGTNDAPVAQAVSASGLEDATSISVTPARTDVDQGDTATYAVATNPLNGTVTFNSTTGTFSYVPRANFNGVDSFTYTVTDGSGASSTATATVTVGPVNDAPVGQNLTVSGNENTEIRASVSASDIDGDVLRFAIGSQPANGTVSLGANSGEFIYISKPGFVGQDSFTYTVSDAGGLSDTKTITVNVLDLPNILTTGNDVVSLFGSAAQSVIGNEATYNSGDVIVGSASDRDLLQLQLDPSDPITVSSASVSKIEVVQVSANPTDRTDDIDLLMTNVSTDVKEIRLVKSTAWDIGIQDIQAAPGALPLVVIDDVGARVEIQVDNQDVLAGNDQLNMEIKEFGTNAQTGFGRANLTVDPDVEILQITDKATSAAFGSDIDRIYGGYHTVNVLGGTANVPLTISGPGEDSGNESGGFFGGVTSAQMRLDSTAFAGNLIADIDAAADGLGAPITYTLDGNSVTVTPGVFTGAGNDSLSAHDDVLGVIEAGGGNDTVRISSAGGGVDLFGGSVRGGEGNDAVFVQDDVGVNDEANQTRVASLIDLGAGNDTAEVGGVARNADGVVTGVTGGLIGVGSQILGGAGNDAIVGGAVEGAVDGGADNDTITLFGDVSRNGTTLGQVMGGSGNDTIRVTGTILGNVSGGEGNDSITTSGTLGDANNTSLPAALGNIDGGDGNDTISHTGLVSEGSVISGGAGDDTMTVAGTIQGNLVDALTPPVNDFQAAAQVNGGDGNDSLTITSGTFDGKVNMGTGNDTVTIRSAVVDGTGAVDLGTGDDSIVLQNRSWTGVTTDGALGNDDAIMGGEGSDSMTLASTSAAATTRAGVVTATFTNEPNGSVRMSFLNSLVTDDPGTAVDERVLQVSVATAGSLSATVDALVAALNANTTVAAIWTASKNATNQLVLTSVAFGSADPSLAVTAAESLNSAGATTSNTFSANLSGTDAAAVGPWSVTSDGTGTAVTGDANDGTDITSVETLNLTTADGFDGDENSGTAGTQDREFDHTFNIALEAYDSALAAINVTERDDSATVNLTGYASEQINIDSDGDQEGGDDPADVMLNVNDTQGAAARALNVALNGTSAYSVRIIDDNRINTTNLAVNGTGNRTVMLDSNDQDNNGDGAGEGNSLIITGNNTGTLTVTGIYQETVNGAGYSGNQWLTIADDGGNETLSITTGAGNDVINIVADQLNFNIDTATGNVTGDSIDGGAGTDRLIIDSSTPNAGNSVDQDYIFKRIRNIEELEVRGEDNGTLFVSIENDAREAGIRTVIVSNNGEDRGNVDLDIESDFTTGSNGPAMTVNVQSSDVTIDNGANVHLQLNIDAAKASAGGVASGAMVNFNGGSGTGSGTVNVNVNVASGVVTNVGGVWSANGQMVNTGAGASALVDSTIAGHVNLMTTTGTIDSFKLTDAGTDQRVNVTWNDAWAQGVSGFVVDLGLANDDDAAGDADLATGGVNFVGAQENDTSFVITGSANSDTLWGSQMGDTITAGAGNDFVNADPNGVVVSPGVQMVKTLAFDETQIIETGDRVSVTIGGRTYTWTAPAGSGEDSPDGQQLGNTSALNELVQAINTPGDSGEDNVTETGNVDDSIDGDDVSAELLGDVIRITGTGVDPTFGYPLGENPGVTTGLNATLMNRPTAIVDLANVGALDVGDVVRISINGVNHNATVRADIDAGTPGNQPETATSLAAQLVASVNGGSNMTAVQEGTQVVLRGNTPATAYTLAATWSTDQVTTPASAKTVTVNYTAPAGGDSVSVTFAGGITVSSTSVAGLVAAINANGTLAPQWTASNNANTLTLTANVAGPFAGANDFSTAAFNGSGTASFTSVAGQSAVVRTDNTDPTVSARTATFTFEDGSYDAGDVVSVTINGVTTNVTLGNGGTDTTNDVNLTGAQVAAQVSAQVSASGVTDSATGNQVTFDAGPGGMATFLVTLNDSMRNSPTGMTAGDVAETVTLDYSAVVGGATSFSATINGTMLTGTTLVDLVNAINASPVVSGANGYDATLVGNVITLTGPANGTEPFGTAEPADAPVSGGASSSGGAATVTATAGVAAVRRIEVFDFGGVNDGDGADFTIGATTYAAGPGTAATVLANLAAAINAGQSQWVASVSGEDLVFTGPADGSNPGNLVGGNSRDVAATNTIGAVTAADVTNGEIYTITLVPTPNTNGITSISVTFDTTNPDNGPSVDDTVLTGSTTINLAALINSNPGGALNGLTAVAVSATQITITGPSSGAGSTTPPILVQVQGDGTGSVALTAAADNDENPFSQVFTLNELAATEVTVITFGDGTSTSVTFGGSEAATLTAIGNAIEAKLFPSTTGVVTANAAGNTVQLDGPNATTNPATTVTSLFTYVPTSVGASTVPVVGAPAVRAMTDINLTNWDQANESVTVTFANGDTFTVAWAGSLNASINALVTAIQADPAGGNGEVDGANSWLNVSNEGGNTLRLVGPTSGAAPLIGFTGASIVATNAATMTETFESWDNTDNNNPTIRVTSGLANVAPTAATSTAGSPAATGGESGNDSVLGGDGNDTINGYGGADTLSGDAGNDSLSGGDGPDQLLAGDGNDWASGGAGDDNLVGGAGNDTLDGGGNADNLDGGAGLDRLIGGDGNDTVNGGDDNDFIRGGTGRDVLTGGSGNDTFYFAVNGNASESQGSIGNSDAITDFASGSDTLQFNFNVSFYGNVSNTTDLLAGLADTTGTRPGRALYDTSAKILYIDFNGDGQVNTNSGDVVIDLTQSGTASLSQANFSTLIDGNLIGGAGNDLLIGTGGNDAMNGNGGNDTIFGGAGNDTLTGGSGADVFHFASTGDAVNTITDFVTGTDKLQYTATTVAFAGVGTSLGTNLSASPAAGKAFLVFNGNTNAPSSVLHIDVDGNGTSDIQLTLTGVSTMTQADFLSPLQAPQGS